MLSRLLSCVIFSLFSVWASTAAALELPKALGAEDRIRALQILGPGSAYKILGDPYPLGGYTGLELGLSYELMPTADLSSLGAGSPKSVDTSFMSLTFGKGLFRDVDLFLHFAPPGQWEQFTSFGAALRWGIYELPLLPIHFSLQVAGSSTGFANQINTTTQGVDLVSGWNFEDLVLYAGVGYVRSSGIFMGGPSGVTDTAETMTESISSAHSLAGLTIKYGQFFLALQMDRSTEASYSAKLGARF